jgi:hypothetical protein
VASHPLRDLVGATGKGIVIGEGRGAQGGRHLRRQQLLPGAYLELFVKVDMTGSAAKALERLGIDLGP